MKVNIMYEDFHRILLNEYNSQVVSLNQQALFLSEDTFKSRCFYVDFLAFCLDCCIDEDKDMFDYANLAILHKDKYFSKNIFYSDTVMKFFQKWLPLVRDGDTKSRVPLLL